jgi:hypothetical protein
MPNIESLKENNHLQRPERFNRIPATIDREQLEYTFSSTLKYGTIVLFVILGLGSITYMTVQQLRK